MKHKIASLIAAVGLLCLAPGIASAGFLTFDFENQGTIDLTGNCGPFCYTVKSTGTVSELLSDEVPGTDSWSFTGYMTFQGFPSFGTGTIANAVWSFVDDVSDNDLSGTLKTTPLGLVFGSGWLDYTVTGGSGLFAGATGNGWSFLSTSGNWFADVVDFAEFGRLYVTTRPLSVPEPDMGSLLVAGFAMLGFVAYRRRRAQLPLN